MLSDFYIVGGTCRLVQTLSKEVWRFLRKLNIELPHDLAISLLGIYPDKILNPKLCMHPYVHSSMTYNSQDLGAT